MNEPSIIVEVCINNLLKLLPKKIGKVSISLSNNKFISNISDGLNYCGLSTTDKNKINNFLEFIYTNMKEIIKSISKSNLNEITDFFGDMGSDEKFLKIEDDKNIDINIENKLL